MIAETKSISKAAQKLYLTQSALNQQLIHLEDELGIQLFCSIYPDFYENILIQKTSTMRSLIDRSLEEAVFQPSVVMETRSNYSIFKMAQVMGYYVIIRKMGNQNKSLPYQISSALSIVGVTILASFSVSTTQGIMAERSSMFVMQFGYIFSASIQLFPHFFCDILY